MFLWILLQFLCLMSTKKDTFPMLQMRFRCIILLNKRKMVFFDV